MTRKPLAKVLVLGIDSGEPSMVTRYAAEGLLPNIQRLQNRSVWGRVANPKGFESSAVWPTFQTAKRPGNMGQYEGLRYFDPQTYDFDHFTEDQVPEDYLWQRLSRAGKRCFVFDAPYALLDRSINGTMIVDWGPHLPAKGYGQADFQTQPPEVAEEVLAVGGPDPFCGEMCDDLSIASAADYREFVDQHIDRIQRKAKIASYFLKKGDWDYFQTVFPDMHCVGHHVWHISDENHPDHDPDFAKKTGDLYKDAFIAIDQAIGDIMANVDDRSLTLLYFSHGMRQQRTGTGVLDRALALIDGQTLDLGGATTKTRLKKLWQKTPAEFRSLVAPLRRKFRGALEVSTLLENRDDRRFFEVHNNRRTGGVRLNLIGREANGKVAPEEFDMVLDEIIAELSKITNVESGTPLVEEFIKTRDVHDGHCIDRLPDLLVRWNQHHPIRAVTSPTIGRIDQNFENTRSGDHSSYGLFAAQGGGIERTPLNHDVNAEDFGLTLMEILGVSPEDTDGDAIEQLLVFDQKLELAS